MVKHGATVHMWTVFGANFGRKEFPHWRGVKRLEYKEDEDKKDRISFYSLFFCLAISSSTALNLSSIESIFTVLLKLIAVKPKFL